MLSAGPPEGGFVPKPPLHRDTPGNTAIIRILSPKFGFAEFESGLFT
jgi:hypothetical protein